MAWPHSLRALSRRDLRRFFFGQSISLIGTWMQSVAMGWLVFRLTHSTRMLGLVAFLSQAPVFFVGLWTGSLADRLPRRTVVIATQLNALAQATILAALTFGGRVQPWHLLPLAAMLGIGNAFEIPSRHALLADLAGDDMPNAVAINSTVINAARVLGPTLAGYVVASVGEAWCFALNAGSFLTVLWALRTMEQRPPVRGGAHSLAHVIEGLRYAFQTAFPRALLLLLLTSSLCALPYQALMPAFAADILHGGPELLGRLSAFAGLGAVLGAIGLLRRRGTSGMAASVGQGASILALGLALFSMSREAWISYAALVLVGFGYITQMAGTLTLLQSLAPGALRGRIVGVFSVLFTGVTPFGALAAGSLATQLGAPHTLLLGALAVLLASAAFHASLPGLRRIAVHQHPTLQPAQVP